MHFLRECIYIFVILSAFLVSLFFRLEVVGQIHEPEFFLFFIALRTDSCDGNFCCTNNSNAGLQGLMITNCVSESLLILPHIACCSAHT